MSFRKEKKYRFTVNEATKCKNKLLNSGMLPLYPPRIINSCYFDTKNFQMFNESEEGVLPRKKIRVRWYSQDSSFTKEVKISSIEGRFKYSSLLSNLKSFCEIKKLKFFDKLYGTLFPCIIISYSREYFLLKNLRITFDKNITYKSINMRYRKFYDPEHVMEVKVPIDFGDDYIENYINMPTSRFSKYSRGVLSIL